MSKKTKNTSKQVNGTHKQCGGQICNGGCEGCGADFIPASRIIRQPKPAKTGKK